ncbi:MAG TPA: nucleotidyltransferase domain-containing protein [Vicinamibacteria bacterium]|nr:nucleotidyltransferase domain-containing protein [Vicinamibacteria bacterium]
MSTVVVKSVDLRALRRAVDAWAEQLLEQHEEIEEVVVFGSFEAGNWSPGSDLDVFLVLSHADRPVRERAVAYLPGAFPVGLDIFPFTRAEIAERSGSPLLAAVARSRWRYARQPRRR